MTLGEKTSPTSSQEKDAATISAEGGAHRAEESRSVGDNKFEKRQGMVIEDGEDQLAMESQQPADQIMVESGHRDQVAIESNINGQVICETN